MYTRLEKGTFLYKHNFLISAKTGYMDLFTLKIFNYLLYIAQTPGCVIEDEDSKYNGQILIRVKASDIRYALNYNGTFLYDQMRNLASNLGNVIIYSPVSKSNWSITSIFEKTTYADGTIEVIFTKSAEVYLSKEQLNYTKLDMYDIMRFKSISAIKLFEDLKQHAYKSKYDKTENNHIYKRKISLDELRFIRGFKKGKIKSYIFIPLCFLF